MKFMDRPQLKLSGVTCVVGVHRGHGLKKDEKEGWLWRVAQSEQAPQLDSEWKPILQVLLDYYCIYSSMGSKIHLGLSRESLRSFMHIYRFCALLLTTIGVRFEAKLSFFLRFG